jgi:peptidoglycan/LPS O-acetylase OafA/YrhL
MPQGWSLGALFGRRAPKRSASLVATAGYRPDIDGLRAIAVLPVILFHFGWLPNGYLGVDVFFVISGFLITGIIQNDLVHDRLSVRAFYLRRTRRILPLTLFISLVAFLVGLATLLPDDLENLAESVVATNVFANNILQAITTKNYWDVVNEYKPLMHTWSLGVEEQYYLLYPWLFTLVGAWRRTWLLPAIVLLAGVSAALYLLPFDDFRKFYLIYFRFWELALGGIAAIVLGNQVINHRLSALPIVCLAFLLCYGIAAPREIATVVAVLLSLVILISWNEPCRLSGRVLQNRLMVGISLLLGRGASNGPSRGNLRPHISAVRRHLFLDRKAIP